MDIKSIAELKTYFETNDVPTEEQFYALLDSFWHKQETIGLKRTPSEGPFVQNSPLGLTIQKVVNGQVVESPMPLMVDGSMQLVFKLPDNVDGTILEIGDKVLGFRGNDFLFRTVSSLDPLTYTDFFNFSGGTGSVTVDSSLDPASSNPLSNSALTELFSQIFAVIATPPSYSQPTVSIPSNINRTVETGSSITDLDVNISVGEGDSGGITLVKFIVDDSIVSNDLENTFSKANIVDDIEFKASIEYSQGSCKLNNLGIVDCTGRINAGSKNSTVRTIGQILPYFYGKSVNAPVVGQALISSATKVVSSSSGTVTIDYNAVGEYIWFAIPNTSSDKNTYYVSALDTTDIGAIFEDRVNLDVDSPTALWLAKNYKFYVSKGQITLADPIQLRN